MKHGSLFSGIGGFDLAAEWMGWENIFHCEWNPFGQKILKYYWPNAKSYEDIKQTDFTIHRGTIDILTGGFPCQPYSVAGKQLGTEDDRHLWPEMLRAIREIQPRWIVGENVLGIVNWNGGLVFEEVQTDLENEGYEVQPFILPAVGVNAPHRRDRVWFIAYRDSDPKRQPETRSDNGRGASASNPETRERQTPIFADGCSKISGVDSNSKGESSGRELFERSEEGESRRQDSSIFRKGNKWKDFPSQSPVCHGDDGVPTELDGITIPKWRNESIKAGGNAIVPQVAIQIFKAIEAYQTKSC